MIRRTPRSTQSSSSAASDVYEGQTQFADKTVKERLQRISGVGSIDLVGGRDREVRIWLDAVKMRAYGVTAEDVTSAIRREHAEIPGGRLETPGGMSEFSMKTKGEPVM